MDKWRKERWESAKDKGDPVNIDIEVEHKTIIEEMSKLDKLSDCSAEVPQEAAAGE